MNFHNITIKYAQELAKIREILTETLEYARQTMPSDRYQIARMMCKDPIHETPKEILPSKEQFYRQALERACDVLANLSQIHHLKSGWGTDCAQYMNRLAHDGQVEARIALDSPPSETDAGPTHKHWCAKLAPPVYKPMECNCGAALKARVTRCPCGVHPDNHCNKCD